MIHNCPVTDIGMETLPQMMKVIVALSKLVDFMKRAAAPRLVEAVSLLSAPYIAPLACSYYPVLSL